jgi:hypothetical protein
MWWAFHVLVWTHIAIGSVGLVSFWVPVLARKGSPAHRRWGRVFTFSMLLTGSVAIGMSSLTIIAPVATHPHLQALEVELVRGIFGWMMLYLAILTINLAWYGWLCVLNRTNYARNREWRNLALQGLVTVAAANCAFQGWLIGQPLMLGISIVGFATAATNLHYLYKTRPARNEWLFEHLKGLVGAGISVYTAFFAFGAVRVMPQLALNPVLWAVPLTTGLAIIIYYKVDLARKSRTPAYVPAAAAQLQR